MSLPVRAFSAQVQLPCRVFCGPDSTLELSGTAVSIDTGSLVLAMPVFTSTNESVAHPQLGDKVRLELSLPGAEQNVDPNVEQNADLKVEQGARAKYLAVQARVAAVTELLDGSRHIKFTFRKASFKDRMEEALPKLPKAASKTWRM